MAKIPLINIREAVEQEIRDRLDDIISRLTPVKPTKDGFDRCCCGSCDELLPSGAKFCPHCGRKVKWDDAE